MAKKWNLVKGSAKQNNSIPYDIVPLSAVMGHCLVVPDLVLPVVLYVISAKVNGMSIFNITKIYIILFPGWGNGPRFLCLYPTSSCG